MAFEMIPDCSDQVKKVAEEAKRLAIESNCPEIRPVHLFVSLITKSKIGDELFSDLEFNPFDLLKTESNSSQGDGIDFSVPSKQLINYSRSICALYDFDELNCFGLFLGTMTSPEIMPIAMENKIDYGKILKTINDKGKEYAESLF